MKVLISVLALGFCSFAKAQTVFKDLSHHPIRFDAAFDLQVNTGMALFSLKEGIYGRVSCGRSPANGFANYFDIKIYNRNGSLVGEGYQYMGSADCQNLTRELFDNAARYEFEFGPLNYWNNRELKIKKDEQ